MEMVIRILFVLSICYNTSWCEYDISNVVQGTKMSVNDDMFVSASNTFSNFAIVMHPFRNISAGGHVRCNMRFQSTDNFVHSVAVVGIAKNSTDSENFTFVYTAERILSVTPYVCIGRIAKSTCISDTQCTDVGLAGHHQDYFLIGVDTNGNFAYGFTSSFVFKLDISTNKIILNLTTNSVWPPSGFIPHAMDVADTWAVVAGYGYSNDPKKNYAALGCHIDLSVLINATCTSLTSESTYLVPSNVISYNVIYELSVAIRGNKVIVGVHRLSTVVVLRYHESSLYFIRVHRLVYPDVSSFGRVVDWADDTTIAVLVENSYQTSWSKSEIFFFNENSVTLTTPLFTFPNNQQILGGRLSIPSFARFSISIEGNMAVLLSTADVLIIPIASAGYTSTWVDTIERVFVFYFEQNRCIGGTYKNHSSLGPCQMCPSRTRNPGTLVDRVFECIPCLNSSSTSFCPPASLSDIDLSTVSSYSQIVVYPETTETTDIEDLLVKNIFQISTYKRCLLVSPLFWTLVVSGFCILIMIFVILIKLCECKKFVKARSNTMAIFKHIDIIGEGEMWTGGLATLAIIVLVSFAYWFSASFLQRYPIEKISGPATFSCDQSLVNAQFSTGLELLAIPKSNEAQPIFDFLDSQIFRLTVELINTGFTCGSISTQENLINTKYVHIDVSCEESLSTAVTSVTISVPRHQSTFQLNMTGPYWIGAIRLCIRGASQINASSTLQQLDVCQFFGTPNEAIGRFTYIPIVFVKNINVTQALHTTNPTLYSGLWMPTFSTVELSDEEYYDEFGDYLRYTSSLTMIQISLDERPFFIKNIERPIVRTGELLFHNLLFTSLCIELFAFTFLYIKLCIVPLFQCAVRAWEKSSDAKKKSTRI